MKPISSSLVPLFWPHVVQTRPREYVCGFCDCRVASDQGWTSSGYAHILVCPSCKGPSFFDAAGQVQVPRPAVGDPVQGLPEGVLALYTEARQCMGVAAYISVAHACRTLLSHVAVEKGAKLKEPFASHVQFLDEHHYIPAGAKDWVDSIRNLGGDAAHKLVLVDKSQAETALVFTQLFLQMIYEAPHRLQTLAPRPPSA